MVHPAIRKCVETQPTASWLASAAATASPSSPNLKSGSQGIPITDDIFPAIPLQRPTSPTSPPLSLSPRNEHINFRSLTSVHELQTYLCALLDMMTPLEFSQILRSRIKFLLSHWPPPRPPHNAQGNPNTLSTNTSPTYSPPENAITTASVMGLVTFFLPRAVGHTHGHDLGQMSLSTLHSQLCRLDILLTFLSVSELMQIFRNRLRNQTGPVGLPNVVRGVLDVMHSEFVADSDARGYETHQCWESMKVPAVRGDTKSQSDPALADSPSLPKASICASQTAGKTMDDCPERPPKRVKANTEIDSDVERNGPRLSLYPINDRLRAVATRSMPQESTYVHVSSDVTHAFTDPSSQNTTECYPSSSTLTASQGGLLTGELTGWRESSSMINKRKAGASSNMSGLVQNGCVESAQTDPVSITSLHNVEVHDSDTDISSVEGKKLLVLGANGHPQSVRSSSSALAANQVSKPLSRGTKISRSPLTSRDTFNVLSKMEGSSASSKAYIATSYPYSQSQP